jgi:hypothetical protein
MKPTELKSLISARFKAQIKRPLHIESSPGVGKTQIAAQVAQELGVGFMAIHAPLLQPEDYGFPVIAGDKSDVSFLISTHKFPIERSTCPDEGIFLIDELSQADNSAQKILANLIQEREIHGQRLKSGWLIVSTGNRTVDRAGANRLLSHLKNRITTIELDASLDDWCHWAFNNGISTEVIAFLRFRPELLNAFDPQQEINPTPRAWSEGVSAALGVIDPSLEFPVFKGDVGEGAASEFVGFLKIYRELPSPDMILLNPENTDVPAKPVILYALCGALAHKTTTDNFSRMMLYIQRMPQEFAVLFVRDAIQRVPEIQTSKDFIKWATTDGAKILT